jgi:hypothetical protein
MFPVELISKIVEIILGDIGKNILAKGRDSKRKFARDLFSYYESVKDYRRLCVDLLKLVERERRLIPSHRLSPGTAKKIQSISDEMTELISIIVGKFEGEWTDHLREAVHGESPSKEAKKRFDVLELYDSQLAVLVNRANSMDTSVAYLASLLSRQKVNWDDQQIMMLSPCATDLPVAVESIYGGWWRDKNERELVKSMQAIKFADDMDYEILRNLIVHNMEVIDELAKSIAEFLKSYVALEDLL